MLTKTDVSLLAHFASKGDEACQSVLEGLADCAVAKKEGKLTTLSLGRVRHIKADVCEIDGQAHRQVFGSLIEVNGMSLFKTAPTLEDLMKQYDIILVEKKGE